MDIFSVLTMVGGLSLFLYGMTAMGNGLSKMAGGKLESILEKLTAKRIFAVLLGAAVTAVIQSSSATTVMVVGFVNSGIMQLSQAVGIIMGANVGTTITSWMLSLTGIEGSSIWLKLLKPSSFSPVLALVGIILTMSSKEESKKKDIGNIFLGFAILMFGMETMSGAVAPLAENEQFANLFTAFSNPILGMIVGALLTAVIQSSSASVGILQALCSTGAVSYSAALPIIMGQNIGTCVTSIISSVGAKKNAKRAAVIHLLFNLIGTILFMVVFYALHQVINFAFMGESANAAGIAVIHSLFNIGCCIVLYPFANMLVKFSMIVIPDQREESLEQEEIVLALDERFLERPAFAMEICRNASKQMAEETIEAITMALDVLKDYDENKAAKVFELEERIDRYEDALGSYLVKLSGRNLSMADSRSMSVLLHSMSDFERISDHAINLVEAAQEMVKKGFDFSKNAKMEVNIITGAVEDIVCETVNAFCKEDISAAMQVEPLEEVIDGLTKKIKKHHVKRLRKGKCTIELGLILEDALINLERVSDHCSNIAVEMLAIEDDGYDTHEYFDSLSKKDQDIYDSAYEKWKAKYQLSEAEEEEAQIDEVNDQNEVKEKNSDKKDKKKESKKDKKKEDKKEGKKGNKKESKKESKKENQKDN